MTLKNFVLLWLISLPVASVMAQGLTPSGLWKSIDDASGKATALVRISEIQGEWQGRIEQLFPQTGEPANPLCVDCAGEFKDMPIIGMRILSGLHRVGDEYRDGQILDPDSGKIYQCSLKLIEDGSKLAVRGYLGLPIVGRTEIWLRQ